MKLSITILSILMCGVAYAQSTPSGIACNGLGAQGAVTRCFPGVTYGCQANQLSNTILQTDGQRTSIQFQNTGSTLITLNFGDTAAVANVNGFQVQPGNSYMWSNIGRGNEPGRVATGSVSIILTQAGAPNSCVFMFTD